MLKILLKAAFNKNPPRLGTTSVTQEFSLWISVSKTLQVVQHHTWGIQILWNYGFVNTVSINRKSLIPLGIACIVQFRIILIFISNVLLQLFVRVILLLLLKLLELLTILGITHVQGTLILNLFNEYFLA